MNKIIDAHSHFGIDAFFPVKGNPKTYIQQAEKIGITDVLAMPVPCPKIVQGEKTIILSQNVYKDNNEIEQYRIEILDGKSNKIAHKEGSNPYEEMNTILFNSLKKQNSINFHYVPLVHPYYYSYENLMLQKMRGAKAIKLHGIAGGFEPKKINNDFFKIIESLQIPLILHTDYNPDCYIQMANTPEKWLNTLRPYDIKAMFTHAVRLQQEAIDIINEDSRYITGLGPELLLQSDKQNLTQEVKNFYQYCFNNFKPEKIVFDIDYPWNIHSLKDISLDWKFMDRIAKESTCLDKFFYENITSFLDLERNNKKGENENERN